MNNFTPHYPVRPKKVSAVSERIRHYVYGAAGIAVVYLCVLPVAVVHGACSLVFDRVSRKWTD